MNFSKNTLLLGAALFAIAASVTSCKDEVDPIDPIDPTATVFEVTTDPAGNAAVRITDNGKGIGTRTLDKDTVYILDNKVYVNDGQVLTIEAGTVIKGESGSGANSTALIVARGGRIEANGTATEPIIFTSLVDNTADAIDITANTNSLWGGLIILGKANINIPGGSKAIEGLPTTDDRGLYGGTNDADNSGTLRYISIRHGGAEIGAGNEINGLTLGAVGSGTTIEYVEVFSTFDDGIEWFGGKVDMKYVVVYGAGDDMFDWDEGFTGRVQYGLCVQTPAVGNRGGELNGNVGGAAYQPTFVSGGQVANVTFMGNQDVTGAGENDALRLRERSKGKFYNNVFYNFKKGPRVDANSTNIPNDAESNLDAGDIMFVNNFFGKIGTATDIAGLANGGASAKLTTHLNANGNVADATAGLTGVVLTPGAKGLNPLPTAGGNIASITAGTVPATFFTQTTFVGGFGTTNWAQGWTALDAYGILAD